MSQWKFAIIDDDPAAREIASAMLKSIGCDSDCFESGQQALDVLEIPEKAKQYHGIFLDVLMPGLSGYAVLNKIRALEQTAKIPVVMITSQKEASDFIDGYKEGVDYYLTKPFTVEQIVYALNLMFSEPDSEFINKPKVWESEFEV